MLRERFVKLRDWRSASTLTSVKPVMRRCAGRLNKEIAADLGTSEIPSNSDVHVMHNMQADSVNDLGEIGWKLDIARQVASCG